jgi:hypothetical protein
MSESFSSPRGTPPDANNFSSLFTELRALREDVKILIDCQRVSSTNGPNAFDFLPDSKPYACLSPTESILRDMQSEMKSFKQTILSDLNKIKESCCPNENGSVPPINRDQSSPLQCASSEKAAGDGHVETIKDVAEAIQRQHKVCKDARSQTAFFTYPFGCVGTNRNELISYILVLSVLRHQPHSLRPAHKNLIAS